MPHLKLKNCRIRQSFNMFSLSAFGTETLKKFRAVPNVPIQQLRAQFSSMRKLKLDNNDTPWIYIMGAGTGMPFARLLGICVHLRYKMHFQSKINLPFYLWLLLLHRAQIWCIPKWVPEELISPHFFVGRLLGSRTQ